MPGRAFDLGTFHIFPDQEDRSDSTSIARIQAIKFFLATKTKCLTEIMILTD